MPALRCDHPIRARDAPLGVERAIAGFYSGTSRMSVAAVRDEGGRVSKEPSNPEINKALYTGRRSKYNAVKTVVDGRTFDSKREAEAFVYLKALERAGTLRGLECQVKFSLDGYSAVKEQTEHVAFYIADFVAQEVATGKTVVFDAKGFRNALYRLKCKWFAVQYGIRITEL
jgi:dsDNA-binding SOS-regulon protein